MTELEVLVAAIEEVAPDDPLAQLGRSAEEGRAARPRRRPARPLRRGRPRSGATWSDVGDALGVVQAGGPAAPHRSPLRRRRRALGEAAPEAGRRVVPPLHAPGRDEVVRRRPDGARSGSARRRCDHRSTCSWGSTRGRRRRRPSWFSSASSVDRRRVAAAIVEAHPEGEAAVRASSRTRTAQGRPRRAPLRRAVRLGARPDIGTEHVLRALLRRSSPARRRGPRRGKASRSSRRSRGRGDPPGPRPPSTARSAGLASACPLSGRRGAARRGLHPDHRAPDRVVRARSSGSARCSTRTSATTARSAELVPVPGPRRPRPLRQRRLLRLPRGGDGHLGPDRSRQEFAGAARGRWPTAPHDVPIMTSTACDERLTAPDPGSGERPASRPRVPGRRIAISLVPEFTALDDLGPCEVLERIPGLDVTFVGHRRGVERSDNGFLGIEVDATFDELADPDVVVFPGGKAPGAGHRRARRSTGAHGPRPSRLTDVDLLGSLAPGRGRPARSAAPPSTHWASSPSTRSGAEAAAATAVVVEHQVSAGSSPRRACSSGIDRPFGSSPSVDDAHRGRGRSARDRVTDPRPPPSRRRRTPRDRRGADVVPATVVARTAKGVSASDISGRPGCHPDGSCVSLALA